MGYGNLLKATKLLLLVYLGVCNGKQTLDENSRCRVLCRDGCIDLNSLFLIER